MLLGATGTNSTTRVVVSRASDLSLKSPNISLRVSEKLLFVDIMLCLKISNSKYKTLCNLNNNDISLPY
jgi:hypothetical protein